MVSDAEIVSEAGRGVGFPDVRTFFDPNNIADLIVGVAVGDIVHDLDMRLGVCIVDIVRFVRSANVTDGGEMAVRIVVIEELIFSAFFVDNLISVIEIFVLDAVEGFGRAQTVRIVSVENVQAFVINEN